MNEPPIERKLLATLYMPLPIRVFCELGEVIAELFEDAVVKATDDPDKCEVWVGAQKPEADELPDEWDEVEKRP